MYERYMDGTTGVRTLGYMMRLLSVLSGLIFFGVGVTFYIQANIGLTPWSAFTTGLANVTGLSFGDVSVLVGIAVLLTAVVGGERFGVATVLNIFVIGKTVDLLLYMQWIPKQTELYAGVVYMIVGQCIVSVATYLYMRPGLGCGPRDALMVMLGKRFPSCPIGAIRALLEGAVLFFGWWLNAKIGIGTVIFVFGIGVILQGVFMLFHFDVKRVAHESVRETWGRVRRARGL